MIELVWSNVLQPGRRCYRAVLCPVKNNPLGKSAMAYHAPTFNLSCSIWHDYDGGDLPPMIPPDLAADCQLRWCGRGPAEAYAPVVSEETPWQPGWQLLFPAGTDIRDVYSGNVRRKDVIECPSTSGRFYIVNYVDDVAKGFTNEYRIAIVTKTGEWPIPMP